MAETNKSKKKSPAKNAEREITADDLPFKVVEPKLNIDPNSGLIEQTFGDDDEIDSEKQLWGKNPQRTKALKDLWYDDLQAIVEEDKGPEEAKKALAFMMTSNSLIDLIMDSVPEDIALELSYTLDHTIALALVNKQYNVDLMEEEQKAISIVKREDYDNDDDYVRALEAIEEHWWSIGQPGLEMRSANDAIIEMLGKYGLNE